MNTKQKAVLMRLPLVVAVLIAWVGIALLMTFGVGPSRTQLVKRPIAVAPPPSVMPPPPSFIFTQFVAGGPLSLVTQAPNGSLVVVTQYSVQPLTFYRPDRYLLTAPDGAERVVSLSEFQRHLRSDARSLDLIDFRYRPHINLDDLKR